MANLFLSGLDIDQLTTIIRECLNEALNVSEVQREKESVKYLTRKETASRLKVSLVTLHH